MCLAHGSTPLLREVAQVINAWIAKEGSTGDLQQQFPFVNVDAKAESHEQGAAAEVEGKWQSLYSHVKGRKKRDGKSVRTLFRSSLLKKGPDTFSTSTSDPAPCKATEAVINELHQSDPNGQVFRYAADKNGKPHRYERLPDHINIAALKKTMDGVYNFLEATWSALEDDLQNELQMRAEWEAEMRAEYRE